MSDVLGIGIFTTHQNIIFLLGQITFNERRDEELRIKSLFISHFSL